MCSDPWTNGTVSNATGNATDIQHSSSFGSDDTDIGLSLCA